MFPQHNTVDSSLGSSCDSSAVEDLMAHFWLFCWLCPGYRSPVACGPGPAGPSEQAALGPEPGRRGHRSALSLRPPGQGEQECLLRGITDNPGEPHGQHAAFEACRGADVTVAVVLWTRRLCAGRGQKSSPLLWVPVLLSKCSTRSSVGFHGPCPSDRARRGKPRGSGLRRPSGTGPSRPDKSSPLHLLRHWSRGSVSEPLGAWFLLPVPGVLGPRSSGWETLGESGDRHPAGAWPGCALPSQLVVQRGLPFI